MLCLLLFKPHWFSVTCIQRVLTDEICQQNRNIKRHLAGSHELTILVSPLTIESQAGGRGEGAVATLASFLAGPLRFKNMTPYLLRLS